MGGVPAQPQPCAAPGKAPPHRLQQLQKGPLHVSPGAQGIFMDVQVKSVHGRASSSFQAPPPEREGPYQRHDYIVK